VKFICKILEDKEAEFSQALGRNTINTNWQALRKLYYELFELYDDLTMCLAYPRVSLRFQMLHRSIPERMWNHGIQPMLDLLKSPGPRTSKLPRPENSDYLAAFFRMAYLL
jgi:hypothetical protein